jgi:hypothetical protein
VKVKDVCHVLAISKNTFARKWRSVFTDGRAPEDRRERCALKVFEDERSVAVEEGRAAVLNSVG